MAITLSAAYTATPLAAGNKLAIYCTKQLSAGITRPSASAYQLISISAAAAASPANILAAYNAKFGTLVAGNKIFIKAVVISASGIAAAPYETFAVIT
jgi:hypothetical protein